MRRIILLCSLLMTVVTAFPKSVDDKDASPGVSFNDPIKGGNGTKKDPIDFLDISFRGRTIFFGNSCNGCMLVFMNTNGDEDYSLRVPNGCTHVRIPSFLSGEYDMQIIYGGHTYIWPIIL